MTLGGAHTARPIYRCEAAIYNVVAEVEVRTMQIPYHLSQVRPFYLRLPQSPTHDKSFGKEITRSSCLATLLCPPPPRHPSTIYSSKQRSSLCLLFFLFGVTNIETSQPPSGKLAAHSRGQPTTWESDMATKNGQPDRSLSGRAKPNHKVGAPPAFQLVIIPPSALLLVHTTSTYSRGTGISRTYGT